MSLKLYNTMEDRKQVFEPENKDKVEFYSCGQTIYDDLHVGNARAYAVWDTLRRYLEHKGYTVRHVQNITDVGHLTDDGDQGDDKIEKRAKKLGLEPMELVEEQIKRYFEDTEALNIDRQDIVPRATGHINEMIEYVQKIYDNGYAYEVEGNIYFDLESFIEDYAYGEMANKSINQLKSEAESRVEPDENKRNQYDFALWLNAEGTDHAMRWNARFELEEGIANLKGYPGWHLECSVMSQKYLGETFDIHAGGKDHIFPHHPNERAQCLAATDEEQARYWLHNEFIQVEGEKMSKSEGNFYTVKDLLNRGFSGDAIRLYLMSSHYRTETDFSIKGLEKAESEVKSARKVTQRIRKNPGENKLDTVALTKEFEKFMDDDLNTAKAKQALMEFISKANSELENGIRLDEQVAEKIEKLFQILGVNLGSRVSDAEAEMADTLLELRADSRREADYETADMIRESLQDIGFEVEDLENESFWVR
ncbi:MAG: cysteinyl-tRNA synthetase [Candidatus Nanosalina sp. J07AB43]|nr:MAG: cysteinyl-tRNA synthetase [Candidatus Nanosalina sp. J07AB43]